MTDRPPSPSKPRSRGHSRIAGVLRRALAGGLPLVVGVLGLAVGTLAALGIGYSIYVYKGKPGHWTTMATVQRVGRLFTFGPTYRRGDEFVFSGLSLTLRGPAADEQLSRMAWKRMSPQCYRHESNVRAFMQRTGAEISRIHVRIPSLPEMAADSIWMRVGRVWKTHSATVWLAGPGGRLPRVAVWRTRSACTVIEFRPEAGNRYTFVLETISDAHPRFAVRRETGGLSRGHECAEDIRRQLAAAPPPK